MLNLEILSSEVQAYLIKHQYEPSSHIALKKSPFDKISSSELAQQVDGRQRALKKIPDWLDTLGIYFPPKLNLEQCSSSLTGKFKSTLLHKGANIIDLTGGFGIDSYYFSAQAKIVIHCEINATLSAIVAHNFKQLAVDNVQFVPGDGISYLDSNSKNYDYIYVDPSRRVEQKKVFHLEDCLPNVVTHQDLFFQRSKTIITKLAPLLDISLALDSLKYVESVYILSVDNDCKELLFIQNKGYIGVPQIRSVRINRDSNQEFTFTFPQERELKIDFSRPLSYLYDPDVAITKAGAFKSIAKAFDIQKLAVHTHLYTSDNLVSDFPGRFFKICDILSLKELKKHSKITKANIVVKNFPLKVEEVRKKYKIAEGSNDYLYFCSLANGDHVVIHCQRV